jgi:hypothetical protein
MKPEEIPLDGTFGVGTLTEIKVLTRIKDSSEMREETFTIPYMFLNVGMIATMHKMNLFAGFTLLNESKPTGLTELGL